MHNFSFIFNTLFVGGNRRELSMRRLLKKYTLDEKYHLTRAKVAFLTITIYVIEYEMFIYIRHIDLNYTEIFQYLYCSSFEKNEVIKVMKSLNV